MAARRRPQRPQRARFFFGCEGESEQGYAALLQGFINERRLPVTLDIRICRGGDPLSIIEDAVGQIERQASRRGAYRHRFLLLDADGLKLDADRAYRASALANDNDLACIWSKPDFEAFLLRHLPDCAALRPPNKGAAARELRKRWPEYRKGLPQAELAKVIQVEFLAVVAAVEPELDGFLRAVRLI